LRWSCRRRRRRQRQTRTPTPTTTSKSGGDTARDRREQVPRHAQSGAATETGNGQSDRCFGSCIGSFVRVSTVVAPRRVVFVKRPQGMDSISFGGRSGNTGIVTRTAANGLTKVSPIADRVSPWVLTRSSRRSGMAMDVRCAMCSRPRVFRFTRDLASGNKLSADSWLIRLQGKAHSSYFVSVLGGPSHE
jgi:hypothetical protein